ncbi:translation initiation factor IF-2 [Catalinimonas alkaloidigena]|uniref:Translation initiation factor IF-2 n=2 Tax=Catalinimonas alkaloidigena TaxID=1075417 RepID=A0A1G9DEX5_9BACT|nr:translation initiation factor IF-2 [Catalinimonas alkaloidigena]
MRLSQAARKLNVGTSTIAEHLSARGFKIENNPNSKITMDQFDMLAKEFESSALAKEEASGITIGHKHGENVVINTAQGDRHDADDDDLMIRDYGNARREAGSDKTAPKSAPAKEEKKEETKGEKEVIRAKLPGLKVLGTIDLDAKPEAAPKPKVEEKPKEAPAVEKPATPAAPVEKPVAEKPAAPTPPPAAPKAEPKAPEAVTPPKEEKKAEVPAPPKEEKKEAPVAQKPAAPQPKPPVAPPREEKPAPKPAAEKPAEKAPQAEEEEKDPELIEAKAKTLKGLTVLGKIELPDDRRGRGKSTGKPGDAADGDKKKRKRKRVRVANTPSGQGKAAPAGGGGRGPAPKDNNKGKKPVKREEPTDKEIQEQIKATLARLSGGKGSGRSRSRYRKEKRSAAADAREERMMQEQEASQKLRVTEFISANDLASLMNVSVNQVISACMSMGMFVSINQRLDAETITIIADEFGYEVEFYKAEDEMQQAEIVEDSEEDLVPRAPIVTIMGHVDHGKTSLLDYIRKTRVTEGEAGGITQHIGAYEVETDTGKKITFLDTPGHEAFTAMRARGAKATDVVIVVVAADDSVMPQTKEAINHAQVAGVPIIIAINKVDKPTANPDRIREQLAGINILVEEWGGKYQSEEVSAKSGQGISELLEKVLLEAELLDLKANPDKPAVGTILEASLDKGRGYLATMLVQGGTLRIGDVLLAGSHYGRVKAMYDHRGGRMKEAGPSVPVQVLGLDGAPQAGDIAKVYESDREARDIATRREQILREQSVRTRKHITLDEIGRRLAIGSFKELNVIVKADFDGSVEALSDSLLKLSTEEIQVNIIHKAVGQISEADVMLASTADAIIVGFQVRPSVNARKLAENEEIEIRLYSVIYDAINEIKDAMEGMLAPKVEEVIVGNVEVREVFKISKVGTVAGCYVTDGYIKRNSHIRLVREGIVVYTGEVDVLKRFKDDVAEVRFGYECGISIRNFNDIKVGDVIESFEEREVKRTL